MAGERLRKKVRLASPRRGLVVLQGREGGRGDGLLGGSPKACTAGERSQREAHAAQNHSGRTAAALVKRCRRRRSERVRRAMATAMGMAGVKGCERLGTPPPPSPSQTVTHLAPTRPHWQWAWHPSRPALRCTDGTGTGTGTALHSPTPVYPAPAATMRRPPAARLRDCPVQQADAAPMNHHHLLPQLQRPPPAARSPHGRSDIRPTAALLARSAPQANTRRPSTLSLLHLSYVAGLCLGAPLMSAHPGRLASLSSRRPVEIGGCSSY
ncbi:hypothetical protein BDV95DRAFT_592937 [Massariosphaeria phaeospora]|uniref:Uncharacterized protein n=1 Tax=Massariosphaeria phaeospora TaxID=100035 RepID=A0A7C8IDK0_9PLEO|nr:hypothetical protein BDV95DRAFT_592937 [Massariosphaeria phaeospora]